MKKYYSLSGGMAVSMSLVYVLYGIGLWYGSQLFLAGMLVPGELFTVSVNLKILQLLYKSAFQTISVVQYLRIKYI